MDTLENQNNQENFEDEQDESIVHARDEAVYSNERGTLLKMFLNEIK
jgi:hypothetical protein